MIVLERITYQDIGDVDRKILRKTETLAKKTALENLIDSSLLDSMRNGMIDAIYEIAENLVERKIRTLIEEETGQKPITEGTSVTLKRDMNDHLKAGQTVTIQKCRRFEEDTFGQGWYTYEIDGCVLYDYEFEVNKDA